jgi:protein-S-isoprenylcysteine O-methyltransferase Ste14
MSEAAATGEPADWFTRDRLTRIGVVLFFFVFEVFLVRGLVTGLRTTATIYSPLALSHLLATACLTLFVAMMLALTIVRDQPRLRAAGAQPRIFALIGTNIILLSVFFLPARSPPGIYGSVVSSALILASNILCVVVLRRLGRSFSIMAEARALVTDGPYALVRHPLYLVEEIGILGAFIQIASWPAAVLFLAHFAVQVQRMRNEEGVLMQAFPREYQAYAARTARFIPYLW